MHSLLDVPFLCRLKRQANCVLPRRVAFRHLSLACGLVASAQTVWNKGLDIVTLNKFPADSGLDMPPPGLNQSRIIKADQRRKKGGKGAVKPVISETYGIAGEVEPHGTARFYGSPHRLRPTGGRGPWYGRPTS